MRQGIEKGFNSAYLSKQMENKESGMELCTDKATGDKAANKFISTSKRQLFNGTLMVDTRFSRKTHFMMNKLKQLKDKDIFYYHKNTWILTQF